MTRRAQETFIKERARRCRSKGSLAILLVSTSFMGTHLWAQDSSRLRSLSLAIRNRAPSVEEAKAYAAGDVTASALVEEWIEDPEHLEKVREFFWEMFGTPNFEASGGHQVRKNAQGVYIGNDRGSCSTNQTVTIAPWWSSQPEQMCSDIASTDWEIGTYGQNGYANCATYYNALSIDGCGCGPDQIFCFPREMQRDLSVDLYNEQLERGLWIYLQDATWQELLAGETLLVSRPLYFLYLWQPIIHKGIQPDPEDISTLKSLPLRGFEEVPFPKKGPARAPVVTAMNFMNHYNNFRSRIARLSRLLLCQEIGPQLNLDQIEVFVNDDLSEADRDHGHKAGCASCHYALDNLASAIVGWSDLGRWEPALFKPGHTNISQVGHAFGSGIEGPRELMLSIVERGPSFHQCMARRAWESFTSMNYDKILPELQSHFAEESVLGPRALIRAILTSEAVLNRGR